MRRSFRILMVVATTLWYGVVVPGHTRGVVKLPGVTDSCCAEKAACHDDKTPGPKPHKTDPVTSCALCQLVSVTSVPTVFHIDLQQVYLLTELTTPRYVLPHVAGQVACRSGRDPPRSIQS